ncbi:MAG: hydrolase Nlp/P60 [Crocinitomicaceae bacterium]|nr:hydrolase Nlp/P60 [Crocinitomicaceae bacterium]|tara:strand:+ start:1658 stop:2443 length:786 start_codon:yes stop_codon:yes gene_type:complete
MKYGVSQLSVVPAREEPSDKSEMVTQLLFGEHYKIIEERSKWVKIRMAYDKYECWIDRKQSYEVSKDVYDAIETSKQWTTSIDLAAIATHINTGSLYPLLMGSSLPHFEGSRARWGEDVFEFSGMTVNSDAGISRERIVENAMMYINAPYLWGGRSPFGIDCSGFTQLVYKIAGKKLPRDAYQQAEIGQTLSFVEEAQSGDLAFFDNEEGSIVHVGILLQDNEIIHASGKVRIDKIDHQGIFNVDTKRYSHKLRLIKKILK